MSTAAVRALQNLQPARPPRVAARRLLAVPLSVTVLRSGVPDAVPGRSVDVCEGGVGAILAAELFPGELVGVEFQLPHAGPVLAKARVCYQERLRYGLQFLAIPAEQRAMIEGWAREPKKSAERPQGEERARPVHVREARVTAEPALPTFTRQVPTQSRAHTPRYLRRKILMPLVASVIVAVGVGWWRWELGWQELEARLPGHKVLAAQPRLKVPADVMQRLLIHRVDPVSPEGTGATGDVVLDTVVGRDGSVVSMSPVSGSDALARAAMDSVQWWKFDPYQLNGEPVEVETTVAVDFR